MFYASPFFVTNMQIKVPVNEQTAKLLEKQREPNHAYIMFEKRGFDLRPPGDLIPSFNISVINVEHRPEQATKLDYYVMQKRYKVIAYGNFPKINDPNPRRAQLAKWHGGVNGENPWDELARRCNFYMNLAVDKDSFAKIESEKSELERKLADMSAKLEKLEATNDKAKGSDRK